MSDKLLASPGGRNSHFLPLVPENLPDMGGVTAEELQSVRQEAMHRIATWIYSLEGDCWGDKDHGIPDEYAITDTPVDLGMGLPLIQGQPACTGSYDYTFTRYDSTDLQEKKDANGNFISWEVKPGVTPKTFQDHASINDQVRGNVMSYWLCHPERQTFSPDQVKRMHFVLEKRRKLIGRQVYIPRLEWQELIEAAAPTPGSLPIAQLRPHYDRLTPLGPLVRPTTAMAPFLDPCGVQPEPAPRRIRAGD